MQSEETSQQPEITWRKVLRKGKFCNMNMAQTEAALGMDTYLEDYGGGKEGQPDLRTAAAQEDLVDWQLRVPFTSGHVNILCCPEDRRCSREDCMHGGAPTSEGSTAVPSSHHLCEHCELPVCKECWKELSQPCQDSDS